MPMACDSTGGLYLATDTRVYKIDSAGVIATIAGGATAGIAATAAPLRPRPSRSIGGLAVDAQGNVYIADSGANRVRMIVAQAPEGSRLSPAQAARAPTGDGGSAGPRHTVSRIPQSSRDRRKGNVYIADVNNLKIRMVSAAGIISTVVGNGSFGRPTRVLPPAPFRVPTASRWTPPVTSTSPPSTIPTCTWFPADPSAASSGTVGPAGGRRSGALGVFFYAQASKSDPNGDVYAIDVDTNSVRKLIVNTPVSFTIVDGNNQTATAGQALPRQLKVQVNGRVGAGVSGVT